MSSGPYSWSTERPHRRVTMTLHADGRAEVEVWQALSHERPARVLHQTWRGTGGARAALRWAADQAFEALFLPGGDDDDQLALEIHVGTLLEPLTLAAGQRRPHRPWPTGTYTGPR